MAVCSGCAGGSVVNHSDTTCIHLTGDGSIGTPLTATQQVDPTTSNCLNCGPSGLRLVLDPASPAPITCGAGGLSVSAGSSACAQKTIFTVATTGPVGFGADLGTQEPFRSCADFLGDGVNDQVAVQAAVDAAAYVVSGTFLLALEVQLLNGIYVFQAAVDTKSVPIKGIPNGSTSPSTLIYNSILYAGPGNRFFDNAVFAPFGLPGGIKLQHISLNAGGAAAIRWVFAGAGGGQAIDLDDVFINAFGTTGADPAFITADNVGIVKLNNFTLNFASSRILDSRSTLSATTLIIEDSILGTSEYAIFRSGANGFGPSQIHNNFIQGGIYLEDTVFVIGNEINAGSASGISAALHLVGANDFIIRDNLIRSNFHGILIDGPGGDVSDGGTIIGNRIYSWGSASDGILVQNNVQYIYIASNSIHSPLFSASRYAINISTATVLDAIVHNNRLRRGGSVVTGYFNDAGTRTLVDLGDHIIRKVSNETVTSSAAPQLDNELLIQSFAPNEIWELEFVVFYDGDSAGDIRFGLSVPTGATFTMGVHALGVAAVADTFDLRAIAYTAGSNDFGAAGAGTVLMAIIKAIVICSTTSGAITLTWAQGTPSATATTVFANSYMKARQIR